MKHRLIAATETDREWLNELRRSVYQELFELTFGGWDEARHQRHCNACWERGGIWIVEVNDERIGMIQLLEQPDAIEIGEFQIQPTKQNRGIGGHLLKVTIASARAEKCDVILSVGLKNENAKRLYKRMGFVCEKVSESHSHMRWTRG